MNRLGIAFFVCLFFLLRTRDAEAALSEKRAFQLDSITTNIPSDIRRDLHQVHAYLDGFGQTEEEKVWLFYGYIGTWFKYDYKRFKDPKAKDYSPEYTASRSNGVCRDFAKVFATLCLKSGIPCFEVRGKTPRDVLEKIVKRLQGSSNAVTHAWNVVRIGGEWQLMDPTWTSVEKTEKIRTWVPKKKTYAITLVKSVRRQYYDPSPEFMAETHVPTNPAFFLLSRIVTFKTGLKKDKKQKTYADNYPFAERLNAIWSAKYPAFSKVLYDECIAYSGISHAGYDYKYELGLPLLKTSKYNPPTIEGYDRALAHVNDLTAYLKDSLGKSYRQDYDRFVLELQKRRAKLVKLQQGGKRR